LLMVFQLLELYSNIQIYFYSNQNI
jgi:hypothetical protein